MDYRCGPEHLFPGAVEDAYLATKWTADNADEIGAGEGLAVVGESAGGNLAAVVAQMAVEKEVDAPEIEHQVLLYPVTDHSYDTKSYEENADGYFLTARGMVWFWNHYLRDDIDGANPRALHFAHRKRRSPNYPRRRWLRADTARFGTRGTPTPKRSPTRVSVWTTPTTTG